MSTEPTIGELQKRLARAKEAFQFICVQDKRLATPDYAKYHSAYTAFIIAEKLIERLNDMMINREAEIAMERVKSRMLGWDDCDEPLKVWKLRCLRLWKRRNELLSEREFEYEFVPMSTESLREIIDKMQPAARKFLEKKDV